MKDLFNTNQFLISNKTRLENLISTHKSDIFFYLTGLRLFPGSPNWIMNITFPHIGIPLHTFFLSVFIGIAPWNFFSCSAGKVLNSLSSTNEIMSKEKYFILFCLFLVFCLFPFLKKRIFSDKKERKEE